MSANGRDKLTPGQFWTPPRAEIWNNMVDVAQDYANRRSYGDGGSPPPLVIDPSTVLIRNSSGSDRRQGEILEIEGLDVTDITGYRDQVYCKGYAPDFDKIRRWVVLLRPLKTTEIGPAKILGACVAWVDCSSIYHVFATIEDGNCVLQSAACGPIRLLYRPSGTGEKECLVELPSTRAGVVLKTSSTITAAVDSGGTRTPGSGTGDVYRMNGSGDLAEVGDMLDVTVYNMTTQTSASGKYIQAKFDLAGTLWWDVAEC